MSNTKNAVVTFSSSNPEVASVAQDGAVAIKAVGTTVISASAEENEQYNKTVSSYTLHVMNTVESIQDFLEKEDKTNSYIFANPAVVIAQESNNLWIQDISGQTQVYGNVGQKYNKGDVIPASYVGTYGEHSGFSQIVDPKGFEVSQENRPLSPEKNTIDAIVRVDNKLGVKKPTEDGLYDVEGIAGGYIDDKTQEYVEKVIPMNYQKNSGNKNRTDTAVPQIVLQQRIR